MDTNVHGVYNCCRAVYPHMKEAGGGKVVIVSSIAGIRGWCRGGHSVQPAVSKQQQGCHQAHRNCNHCL
jgi:NADP-dependent 3-hydroxy acid dehydrogenase YdfG